MRDTSSGRMRTGVTGLALAVMVACVMFRAESGIARTYSFDAFHAERWREGGGPDPV